MQPPRGAAEGAAPLGGGVPLRTLLALGLDAAGRAALRGPFARLPLSEHLFGRTVVVEGRGLAVRAGGRAPALGPMLPVATPLLAALINAEQALGEFGLCAGAEALVLGEPPVSTVGLCAHRRAAEQRLARNLTHCAGDQAVLCADGVCRDTYVDCFRARCVGAEGAALGCASMYSADG